MVASYTSNGRITKQGTDDNPNTWGTVLNNQVVELFEEAVFGVADVDITGSSDFTLSTNNGASDEARHAVLELTGLVGADIDVILPAAEKVYMVRGAWSGDYTVSLKIGGGSATSIPVSIGDTKIIYTNGTDSYDLVDLSSYLDKANNLSDLIDAPTARSNLGLGDYATGTLGTAMVDSGGAIGVDLLDEDDFASNSDTKPPSQQSVAAYIAANTPSSSVTQVSNSTTQSMANGTWVLLAFDQEEVDTDDWHDTTTNNSRITVDDTASYLVVATLKMSDHNNGDLGIRILVNGVEHSRSLIDSGSTPGNSRATSLTNILVLNSSDYVEVEAYQISGSTQTAASAGTYLALTKLG